MGVETLIGAVIAATSVVTGVMQYTMGRKASAERKEANAIANAQQKNESADSRRKAIREARVRRAMVLQQSENAGATGSSGSQGATGVINTNLGSANAFAQGQTKAIQGINNRNQRAADYDYKGQMWGLFGSTVGGAFGAFQTPSPNG